MYDGPPIKKVMDEPPVKKRPKKGKKQCIDLGGIQQFDGYRDCDWGIQPGVEP